LRYQSGRVPSRKAYAKSGALGALGVLGVISLAVAAFYAARRGEAAPITAEAITTPAAALLRWPGPAAALSPPPLAAPEGFGVRRVYIDAGHGARDNRGAISSYCVDEQDFTLAAALAVAARLEATGHFEARLSREGSRTVEYRDRIAEAAAWGAEAFVSLHSDVRGRFEMWSPSPGLFCRRSLAAPGFSVLWSDEGDAALAERRLNLARRAARRMRETGFPPYAGAEYTGLYEADGAEPGVFVDRHAPDQRIFILRRTSMPAILIETHHALDPREAARWNEPGTLDAFAAALGAALVDELGRPARTPSPAPVEGRR
jgi:N-acetylmuramoyl-L-alanine amidase